jgi:hypothetical protein
LRLVLVADLDIRILTTNGDVLRALTLDATRDYQRRTEPGLHDHARHTSADVHGLGPLPAGIAPVPRKRTSAALCECKGVPRLHEEVDGK